MKQIKIPKNLKSGAKQEILAQDKAVASGHIYESIFLYNLTLKELLLHR